MEVVLWYQEVIKFQDKGSINEMINIMNYNKNINNK